MATTKILPVRKRLKDCLDYAANPKKTEIFRGDALDRLMHYTQNEDKTEHQLYVTGFNCDPQNACLIMEATKRRWHKDIGHGNVGYHIIQSFKPGEAGPDQVHQIGCELARRCLADRFECTVSTHLDKGHLHNHIVVNSVSFMDGKMFRNDFKTYYQGIRQISDDLCRQNRLSVIETDGRGISYGEWRNRREGKPSERGILASRMIDRPMRPLFPSDYHAARASRHCAVWSKPMWKWRLPKAPTLTILSTGCKRWAMRSSTVPASSTWRFGTKTAKGLCGWTV